MAIYKVQGPNGEIIEIEGPEDANPADVIAQAQTLYQPKAQEPEPVPAMGAVVPGPTGMAQLGRDVVQASKPLIEAGKQAWQGYTTSPGKAIVDVGAAHLGLPPPYATAEGAKGLYNTFKGAAETVQNLSDIYNKLPAGTDKVAATFVNSLTPADQTKFMNLARSQGIEQAFKTYQAPGYLSPEAVQSLNATRSAFPSTAQKIGQTIAGVTTPIVRGASKVIAPLGAALETAQGVNQARQGDYTGATLSGLGALSMFNPAGLIAQPGIGMMQSANQNFRQQTPQQQRESAMSALSGTAPGMFGGDFPQQQNEDAIRTAIRIKAAKKVLGQP